MGSSRDELQIVGIRRIPNAYYNNICIYAKIRRHYENIHLDHELKRFHFFKQKRTELLTVQNKNKNARPNWQWKRIGSFLDYELPYGIIRWNSSIAETLIKPCVIDIATSMLNDKSAKYFSTIHLSNNTVAWRVANLDNNVAKTLGSCIKSKFALKMDESTDIISVDILLIYLGLNSVSYSVLHFLLQYYFEIRFETIVQYLSSLKILYFTVTMSIYIHLVEKPCIQFPVDMHY